MTEAYKNTDKLLWVMEQLRDPETGCPWDREQVFETIVPYTIEEAYEVADAIEHGDMDDIKDELGDLLFQVVFYAQLGKEQAAFDFEAIAGAVAEKLIRRHPHVFGDTSIETEEQLNQNWEAIKQQERIDKGKLEDQSILANVPKGMAPLVKAHKLQKKCAKVGFDWTELPPVVDKIKEEIDEVLHEVTQPEPNQEAIKDEVGDLLFAVVNLARHVNVDAEAALRQANHKFESRFRKVEQRVLNENKNLVECSLDELEEHWQEAKKEVSANG